MNVAGSLMVAVSKLKSRLGSPPESSAVKDNLRQPEEVPHITDGRSLRATGRTVPVQRMTRGRCTLRDKRSTNGSAAAFTLDPRRHGNGRATMNAVRRFSLA